MEENLFLYLDSDPYHAYNDIHAFSVISFMLVAPHPVRIVIPVCANGTV